MQVNHGLDRDVPLRKISPEPQDKVPNAVDSLRVDRGAANGDISSDQT